MEAKRPFSQLDWLSTPEPVREYIIYLERLIGQMQQRLDAVEKRTEKLEARTRMNSQNSSKPPSTDSPFNKQKKKTKKSKTKRGGQKGHKGYQQQMLNPTNTLSLLPQNCDCGKLALDPNSIEPFCTHQHIELPKIQLAMDHGKLCSCFAIGQKNLRMKISGPTFTQSFCFF
jgi:transposase